MRKLSCLILFIFFYAGVLEAQMDTAFATARYTLTHILDTTQPERPRISNTILYLGKSISSYGTDRSAPVANSNAITTLGTLSAVTVQNVPAGGSSVNIAAFNTIGNYYKDVNSSNMSNIALAGMQIFAVEEKILVIDWAITQDTKEIMGMPCQKATGDFKGRTYEAWFSTQLPYSNGPWKLGGLPGLILEASDTRKEVVFKLVSFENANGAQTAIGIPSSVLKTTPKEFKEYQDAVQRDRDASLGNSRSMGGGNLMVVSGSISAGTIGPDGKPVKPLQMNNPIEKETKNRNN